MTLQGIDCASTITATIAQNLKDQNIQVIGRYLTGNFALTSDEVSIIHGAGLSLFLIYETNGTHMEYFSYSQGQSDSQSAIEAAISLGASSDGSITIYFCVDYDAQSSDMERIEGYFEGVQKYLDSKFMMGAYGSYSVLDYLYNSTYKPDRYMQTIGWSGGKVFHDNQIYQKQCDTQLCGIGVDLDEVLEDAGLFTSV